MMTYRLAPRYAHASESGASAAAGLCSADRQGLSAKGNGRRPAGINAPTPSVQVIKEQPRRGALIAAAHPDKHAALRRQQLGALGNKARQVLPVSIYRSGLPEHPAAAPAQPAFLAKLLQMRQLQDARIIGTRGHRDQPQDRDASPATTGYQRSNLIVKRIAIVEKPCAPQQIHHARRGEGRIDQVSLPRRINVLIKLPNLGEDTQLTD